MANKTIEEQIAELQKKQSQLKAKEKALKAKQTQAERKARTKRLIEVGAVIEKAFDIEFREPEQREKLLHILTEEKTNARGQTYSWACAIKSALKRE